MILGKLTDSTAQLNPPHAAWYDEPDVIFYLYAGISAVCVAVILGVIVIAIIKQRGLR